MDSNALFYLLRFLLAQFWNVTFNDVARPHPILRYLNRGHPEAEHRCQGGPFQERKTQTSRASVEPVILILNST